MSQDLTKTPQQIMTDLVNRTNGTAFTPAQLVFGTPEPMVAGSDRNTMVSVTPAAGAGFTWAEPVTIFYNRIDLAQLFSAGVPTIEDDGSFTTSHDLIPGLNALRPVAITTGDIIDEPLDLAVYPAGHVVKAAANSLVYFGQVSCVVTDSTPNV